MAARSLLPYICILLLTPSVASGAVIVRDDISVVGKTVMLAAETRGRFFRAGGEIVEFIVNGESIGRTLSGGDGMAYMEYVPNGMGSLDIRVLMGDDAGEGLLRVASRGAPVLLIEVFGSLIDDPIERSPRKGAKEAVYRLGQDFVIVYVQSYIPPSKVRKWLDKYEFVRAPVMPVKADWLVRHINKIGLELAAVVGSADFVGSFSGKGVKRFSFQKAERSEKVGSWDDLVRALLSKE